MIKVFLSEERRKTRAYAKGNKGKRKSLSTKLILQESLKKTLKTNVYMLNGFEQATYRKKNLSKEKKMFEKIDFARNSEK